MIQLDKIPIHLCKYCSRYSNDIEKIRIPNILPRLLRIRGCIKAHLVERNSAIIVRCPRFERK